MDFVLLSICIKLIVAYTVLSLKYRSTKVTLINIHNFLPWIGLMKNFINIMEKKWKRVICNTRLPIDPLDLGEEGTKKMKGLMDLSFIEFYFQ